MNKTLLVCLSVGLILAGFVLSPMPLQAQVKFAPSSLSFGSLPVNTTSAADTVVVTNTNRRSIAVTKVLSSLSEFIVSSPALPFTLRAGGSASFQVVFLPNAAQTFSGKIVVTLSHQDGMTSTHSTPVTGTGVSPAPPAQTYLLSASTSSLSFGNALVGSSAAQTMALTNSGTGSVTISQAAISGAGFSVSGCSGTVTLTAGQSLTLTVGFAPATAGSAAGSISVASSATNSPATIALSGTGVQPQISVSPASASFGTVVVGASSSQALTIKNTGTANLSVTQAALAGSGFTLSGLTLPLTVAPGGTSTFTLGFAPATASSFTGSVTLVSNAPSSPLVVALAGTGVASALQLTASPVSLSFGSIATGTSTAQSVTVTNTGNSSVTVSQISESGTGFSVAGFTVPLTLAAGKSTTFSVTFAPATAASLSGSVTITSTATNSPATIALSGTGIQSQISVTPANVSFGNVTVGVSNTQSITIRNAGTANLSVTQAVLAGTGFTLSGLTVPLAVAPGGSSVFTIGFTPASASSFTGSLTLVNNTANSPLVVALTGTGIAPVLQLTVTPASLSFGSITTGTSTTQSVTVTNSGNGSVTLSQISESGAGFSVAGITVPLTLAAGQATSFNVTFDPASAGNLSGSVTVTSNAANSPQAIALTGTGTAAASYSVNLSWTPSSSSYSGFNVYRGAQSGGPYSKINSGLIATPSYTDANCGTAGTYYYVATEVDTTGAESSYSSPASAIIP
ncbi:MAG: choice-of-anchor D domain-containing protein [Candidatus Acidiferrum sp.]